MLNMQCKFPQTSVMASSVIHQSHLSACVLVPQFHHQNTSNNNNDTAPLKRHKVGRQISMDVKAEPNSPGGGYEYLHDKDLSNYFNFLNRPTAVKTMSCQASVTSTPLAI